MRPMARWSFCYLTRLVIHSHVEDIPKIQVDLRDFKFVSGRFLSTILATIVGTLLGLS